MKMREGQGSALDPPLYKHGGAAPPDPQLITRRVALAGLVPLIAGAKAGIPAYDPQETVLLDLPFGRVFIKLLPQVAPMHVARVKALCAMHFYDGTPFHRVIKGFMAQGGDPTGTGEGGSKLPDLKAEFSPTLHFVRGTVGAARDQDPDSANSQFFIMYAPKPSLDGNYTIWGQVIAGMQHVDRIKMGAGEHGMVTDPTHIVRMRLAAHQTA